MVLRDQTRRDYDDSYEWYIHLLKIHPRPMEPFHAHNPEILQWWGEPQDQAIFTCLHRYQWHWYWYIKDEILRVTDSDIIAQWLKRHTYIPNIWYNALMYFARARAEQQGWVKQIREPARKVCPLCSSKFSEGDLSASDVERFGIDGLDFCAVCLAERVGRLSGSHQKTSDEVFVYIRNLAEALGRIPQQGFGEGTEDCVLMDPTERTRVLRAMAGKPSTRCVKMHFGSWLKALIASGVLGGETWATARGTRCVAKDGHVCLSLAEKTIDDTLLELGLEHTKEPRYPESNFRADFAVGSVFIEYFGLTGTEAYDKKRALKVALAREHRIQLIELLPKDLASQDGLRKKLSQLLTKK